MLIAGNWSQGNQNDLFQCHFGEKVTQGALILPGVLRCVSPSKWLFLVSQNFNVTFISSKHRFFFKNRHVE